jgi:hypothetical protein
MNNDARKPNRAEKEGIFDVSILGKQRVIDLRKNK